MLRSRPRDRAGRAAIQVIAVAVVLALAPIETLVTLAVGGVVLLVSGYVSVALLTGALTLPLFVVVGVGFAPPVLGASLVVTVIVFWLHRDQMKRLRAGTEARIGSRGTAASPLKEGPAFGLWAAPTPHGLLGRSALSAGAVLTIVVTVVVAVLTVGWLT